VGICRRVRATCRAAPQVIDSTASVPPEAPRMRSGKHVQARSGGRLDPTTGALYQVLRRLTEGDLVAPIIPRIDAWLAAQSTRATASFLWQVAVARLREGMTIANARAEVTGVIADLACVLPNLRGVVSTGMPLQDSFHVRCSTSRERPAIFRVPQRNVGVQDRTFAAIKCPNRHIQCVYDVRLQRRATKWYTTRSFLPRAQK